MLNKVSLHPYSEKNPNHLLAHNQTIFLSMDRIIGDFRENHPISSLIFRRKITLIDITRLAPKTGIAAVLSLQIQYTGAHLKLPFAFCPQLLAHDFERVFGTHGFS